MSRETRTMEYRMKTKYCMKLKMRNGLTNLHPYAPYLFTFGIIAVIKRQLYNVSNYVKGNTDYGIKNENKVL